MAIPDRVEQINAVEAAKAEILAALAATNGKIDIGVTAHAIKSIQKGSGTAKVDTSSTTINISPIDMSKSILIITNMRTHGGDIDLSWRLSNNSITFYHYSQGQSYYTAEWYWQVIEFY